MYHVVHLLFFFLFCQNEKGLLNFVSKRMIFLKLVHRINNSWYSFQKNKLPFKLLKPHFIAGRILSKYQLLLHWKSFENIWSFILYPVEAGETELINTCVVAIAELGQKCRLEAASTLKLWTLKQLHHCTQRLNREYI